jgi:hypothetical protein
MAISKLLVEAPAVTRRTIGTLLGAVTVLPGSASDERWMNGITWQPRPSRALSASAVDTCNPADFVNPNYACVPAIEQSAFQIYDAFNASALDHTPDIIDGYLSDRNRLQQSAALAAELLTGAASGGRSLSSTATAPAMRAFGSAAVSVQQGVAILEDDLARTLYGGQGMIHMSPGLLGLAIQNAGFSFRDGEWYTALGHCVVADAGYVDAKEPTGLTASAAMKEWMYASGPVVLGSTAADLLGGPANEFMDMTRNKFVRWMSSYAILQFDPDPVTAVLVDY